MPHSMPTMMSVRVSLDAAFELGWSLSLQQSSFCRGMTGMNTSAAIPNPVHTSWRYIMWRRTASSSRAMASLLRSQPGTASSSFDMPAATAPAALMTVVTAP